MLQIIKDLKSRLSELEQLLQNTKDLESDQEKKKSRKSQRKVNYEMWLLLHLRYHVKLMAKLKTTSSSSKKLQPFKVKYTKILILKNSDSLYIGQGRCHQEEFFFLVRSEKSFNLASYRRKTTFCIVITKLIKKSEICSKMEFPALW